MYEWLSGFLTQLDEQTMTILGAGFGAVVVSVAAGIRGIRKGKPTQGTVQEVANEITKHSCGAPELMPVLREMSYRISGIQTELHDLSDKVTRIEDRTR